MNRSSTQTDKATSQITPHNFMADHFIANNLKAYADGELSSLHRNWIERHLRKCEACRQELHFIQGLTARLHRVEQELPAPSARLRTRILANLPDSTPLRVARIRRTAGTPVSFWQLRQPLIVASSLCTLLLITGAYAANQFIRHKQIDHVTSTTPSKEFSSKELSYDNQARTEPIPTSPQPNAQLVSPSNTSLSQNEALNPDPTSKMADKIVEQSYKPQPRKRSSLPKPNASEETTLASAPGWGDSRPLPLEVSDIQIAQEQFVEYVSRVGGKVSVAKPTNLAASAKQLLLRVNLPANQEIAFVKWLGPSGAPLVRNLSSTDTVPKQTNPRQKDIVRVGEEPYSASGPVNTKPTFERNAKDRAVDKALENSKETSKESSKEKLEEKSEEKSVTFYIRLNQKQP